DLPTPPEADLPTEPLRPAPPAPHARAGQLVVGEVVLVEGRDRGDRLRGGGRAHRSRVDQHRPDAEVDQVQGDGRTDDPAADHGNRMRHWFHVRLHDRGGGSAAHPGQRLRLPPWPPRPSVMRPAGPTGRVLSGSLAVSIGGGMLERGGTCWKDVRMESPPLRVMLVDDHEVVRDGIKALLASAEDIVVCAEAGSVRE